MNQQASDTQSKRVIEMLNDFIAHGLLLNEASVMTELTLVKINNTLSDVQEKLMNELKKKKKQKEGIWQD